MTSRELGDLLRTRRERLRPADVGLPDGERRRTPGLRREEVAQLAGISTTYYTFLEQGRELRPSRQVITALARALRLAPAERAHLVTLADPPPLGETTSVERIPETLAALVDHLDPHPAYVTGRRWDVLAANRAARVLWTDWSALPIDERNMLVWTFTDPSARTILLDGEDEARALLARFRAAAARHPDDPAFASLLQRLRAASPEASAWWEQHDVVPLHSGTKRLRHHQLGVITLRHTVLQLADDPELKLVSFVADEVDQPRVAALLAP